MRSYISVSIHPVIVFDIEIGAQGHPKVRDQTQMAKQSCGAGPALSHVRRHGRVSHPAKSDFIQHVAINFATVHEVLETRGTAWSQVIWAGLFFATFCFGTFGKSPSLMPVD